MLQLREQRRSAGRQPLLLCVRRVTPADIGMRIIIAITIRITIRIVIRESGAECESVLLVGAAAQLWRIDQWRRHDGRIRTRLRQQ